MFRPISCVGHKVTLQSKGFVRGTKIVRPASILKPVDKIKLYNKENKELFGPLLETSKQRKQRFLKEGKLKYVAKQILVLGALLSLPYNRRMRVCLEKQFIFINKELPVIVSYIKCTYKEEVVIGLYHKVVYMFIDGRRGCQLIENHMTSYFGAVCYTYTTCNLLHLKIKHHKKTKTLPKKQ